MYIVLVLLLNVFTNNNFCKMSSIIKQKYSTFTCTEPEKCGIYFSILLLPFPTLRQTYVKLYLTSTHTHTDTTLYNVNSCSLSHMPKKCFPLSFTVTTHTRRTAYIRLRLQFFTSCNMLTFSIFAYKFWRFDIWCNVCA